VNPRASGRKGDQGLGEQAYFVLKGVISRAIWVTNTSINRTDRLAVAVLEKNGRTDWQTHHNLYIFKIEPTQKSTLQT